MNFTADGLVILTRDEFDAMADIVAENERASKGKDNKDKRKTDLSQVEKRELKARIMAEPNQAIRQKLIRENMNLFQ